MNELKHFGILGMKWGVRRYQNKDGTRTEEGKERQRKRYEELKSEVSAYHKAYDKTKLIETSKRFNDLGNQLAEDYDNYYKSLKTNNRFKADLYEKLYEDFGAECDDEDYFEWAKEDHALSLYGKYLPSKISKKVSDFYAAGDEFFEESKKAVSGIADKYSNVEIADEYGRIKNGRDLVEGLFYSNDDPKEYNTQWNSYMYRHFDDYWVNDVESKYELENQFTMSDYNNYAKKRANG